MQRTVLAGSLIVAAAMTGCVDRKIRVTSEPPGARVWLNDTEIGTTPAEADFRFYGRYDVRLEKEGYEPLWTDKKAYAPFWQWPVVDLVADVAPVHLDDVIEWHFELEPSLESVTDPDELRADLLERALELRQQAVPEGNGDD